MSSNQPATNREFRGVWIPAHVWLNKDLSLQEKVLLVEIDSLQHPERGCFKTNKSLGEFIGLSPSRVSHIVSKLEKDGWLRVELIRENRVIVERRIFIARSLAGSQYPDNGGAEPQDGYCENSSNPIAEPQGGYCGNSQESNTSLSNTKRVVQKEISPPNPPKGEVSSAADDVRKVFEHWKQVMGKNNRTVLDSKRRARIQWALKHYGMEATCEAITGCSKSAWHMGDNPAGRRYDDLTLILRGAEQVERFLGDAASPPKAANDNRKRRIKTTGLSGHFDPLEQGWRQAEDGSFY